MKGGVADGAAAVAGGQHVVSSAKASPTQVCALKPMLRGVPETAAKAHSCGAVNTVVSGPRMDRVWYTVTTSCTGVEDAMKMVWWSKWTVKEAGNLHLNGKLNEGSEEFEQEEQKSSALGKTGGVKVQSWCEGCPSSPSLAKVAQNCSSICALSAVILGPFVSAEPLAEMDWSPCFRPRLQ